MAFLGIVEIIESDNCTALGQCVYKGLWEVSFDVWLVGWSNLTMHEVSQNIFIKNMSRATSHSKSFGLIGIYLNFDLPSSKVKTSYLIRKQIDLH